MQKTPGIHRIEDCTGYTITKEEFRDSAGHVQAHCTIHDHKGQFVRRYMKMEDALEYLRAHVSIERLRAES